MRIVIFREIRNQKRAYVYLLAKLHGVEVEVVRKEGEGREEKKVESVYKKEPSVCTRLKE